MKKVLWLATLVFSVLYGSSAFGENWKIDANYADACSCNPVCPCLFGSPATGGSCEVVSLIEFDEGNFDDIQLDGLKVVSASRMGEWVYHYIDRNATDAQIDAFGKLYSAMFPFPNLKVLGTERADISIERTADGMSYSAAGARVHMEIMKGRDDSAIEIHNLPAPFSGRYAQHKSKVVEFKDADLGFRSSRGNGLTVRVLASGEGWKSPGSSHNH